MQGAATGEIDGRACDAYLVYGHGQGEGLVGQVGVHAMHDAEIRVQMHAVAG